MSDKPKITTAGCIAAIIATPLAIVIRGLVLVQLWEWFVVPQFGLAPLTVPVAYGLSLVASLLNPSTDSGMDIWESVTMAIFMPPMFLLFGWIVVQLV